MSQEDQASPARITLARIVRVRGLRGEVAADILTDFPERLTRLTSAYLWNGRGEPRRCTIRSCWLQNRQAIFHFEGSNSVNDAKGFVGLEVQLPFEERMPLAAGQYYIDELVGCEVWEGRELLGRVRNVQLTGGTPVISVEAAGSELLIPLAEEICVRIDTAGRRIEVRLPEGLRELNG